MKAVLFDVGGVLFTLGEAAYRAEVAAALGLPAMPAAYDEWMPALQRGEVSEEEVWAALSGRSFANDAFDAFWYEYFKPDHAMLAFAAEVSEFGYLTAILSNTQHSHVRCMRALGLFEGFDLVCYSNEIGLRKPEAAAFLHVASSLGLAPSEIIFIDDVPEYVTAAQAVGLQAVLHSGDVAATRQAVLAALGA